MQKTPVPLRERNRLDTWALIHDVASSLVLKEGPIHATVEAIAEAAGVSKRTFFNYFATKEDAVLGTQAPSLTEDAVAAFRAGEGTDTFGRTVHLMLDVIRTMFPDASSAVRRKELTAKFPELRTRMSQHVSAAEQLVESVLMERYDDDAARAGFPVGREGASALLMLAGTVLRFAYRRDPAAPFVEGSATVDESIEIFRKAVQATL
ncbi:TetR/AcrR family transcriptional regulator [Specibacter sp. RAF43]|uniref:TetR/AcrR family transcriptional regulator n=1 Tax=Specibacter sp. RAF43 TaxID=3233057 RepID=UPI003F9C4122